MRKRRGEERRRRSRKKKEGEGEGKGDNKEKRKMLREKHTQLSLEAKRLALEAEQDFFPLLNMRQKKCPQKNAGETPMSAS